MAGRVPCACERDVFTALGLPYREPGNRAMLFEELKRGGGVDDEAIKGDVEKDNHSVNVKKS